MFWGKRWTEFDMQNRVWRIDQIHSREICTEVAERLRISLSKDQSATPTSLRKQLDRLREIEETHRRFDEER